MKRSINEYDPNRGGGGGGGSSSPPSGGVGGAKPKDKYTFDRITGSRSAKDYKESEREPQITGQLNFGSPRQSSSNRTPRMSDDYSRGGKVKSAAKFQKGSNIKHEDVKMDKSMMQKAVNKHESRLHKGKPMTKLAKGGYTRAADGCATKGKTKGTMITMNKGGMPC